MSSPRHWLRAWVATEPGPRPARTPARARLKVESMEDRTVPSSLRGVVFDDENHSGTPDAGEGGHPGWTVFLDVNRNGVFDDAVETSTVTDAAGSYTFDTTNEVPAFVNSTTGEEYDLVGIVQPVGAGGRYMNTTPTLSYAIRNSDTEPPVERNFGAYLESFADAAVQPVGPEAAVNVATAGVQGRAAVAADALGNYVVVWSSLDNLTSTIRARLFYANGTPQDPSPAGEFDVGTSNRNAANNHPPLHVDMTADGRFVVAWSSYNSTTKTSSSFVRVFGADGSGGPAVTVSVGDATHTSTVRGVGVADDGRFAVLFKLGTAKRGGWQQTTYTLNVQRFQAGGALNGSAIQVTTQNLVNAVGSLAMDATGKFVVAWEDHVNGQHQVYAQRYDAAGKKLGTKLAFTAGSVLPTASVAMNASGQFVITYSTAETTSVARVFRADGTAAFAPVTVAGDAAVAIDGAGNVTFTWTYNRWSNSTPHGEIRVQRLSATGYLWEELIVNTTTQGAQSGSTVAATEAGKFVIVWEGYGPGDDSGIFMQQYQPA
ncbi:hypothetical protein [Urbifossiella limnaea]|uniref:SD-repeat containing protein B domain-containing protein n=1 Tax=Urbifossiella limnaea TaxID=2528023 RepID=A0A517XPV4_9BACT|nr:hypothetical protein [Urbifossiella limnaea]QDU19528.1 hypothetical protein ETAA1_14570 [Urbifossiella limnaea]